MDLLAAQDLSCINDRCRTCMMKIFTGLTAVNIFERNIQNISIAEILHSFTALTFDSNDEFPKVVCHLCYEKLYSFYQFVLNIENVHTKFQEELKDKDPSSFEGDEIMNSNLNFQEVPVDQTSLRENEESLSIKKEICEEENGGLEPFIKFEVVQEYVCKVCYKIFTNKGNYLRHIKKHLASDVNNTISQAEHPDQDDLCDYKTDSIKIEFNPLDDNTNSDNEADENDIKHSFQEKPAQHITETSEQEGIVCKICSRCFRNKNSLSAHMKIHVVRCVKKLSCPTCGKVFNYAYQLKRHQNVHKDDEETSRNLAMEDAENLSTAATKNEFMCIICKRRFKSQHSMAAHMKIHVEKKPVHENELVSNENEKITNFKSKNANDNNGTEEAEVLCEICEKRFKSKNSLSAHMKIHVVKGRVLSCPTCGKVFNGVYHLKRHQNVHKDDDETSTNLAKEDAEKLSTTPIKNIMCIICKRRFKSQQSLAAHMNIHVFKGRILSCPTCGKVFNYVYHLKRHQKIVHKDDDETSKNLAKEDAENLSTTPIKNIKRRFKSQQSLAAHNMKIHVNKERVLACSKCGKVFPKIYNLKRHELSHEENKRRFKSQQSLAAHNMNKHENEEKVIACSKCGKVFPRIYNLKRHELSHEEKRKYKCGFCNESYLTEEILEQHLKQHSETKICSVCQETFADMLALNKHVLKLHRHKPHLCSYCGKKFALRRHLYTHQQRHTAIKRFPCSICPKNFFTNGELIAHVTAHTGYRHYKCKQCNAGFTQRSSLAQHMFRHLGIKPYRCDVCPKTFTMKNGLNVHKRIHTGEKPHSCDICGQAFTTNYSLVKHRRRHRW